MESSKTRLSQADSAIARVIANHTGDGGVYVPRSGDRAATLARAIEGGFVSVDGFITRKGRRLLAHAAH
ncbi:MAG: hypothetical protein ACU85V_06505 [Gammaproteobacteria bacterium]